LVGWEVERNFSLLYKKDKKEEKEVGEKKKIRELVGSKS